MFEFLTMMGTYELRKVNHTEIGELVVDTCSVFDGAHPFETGIKHPEYNDGKWIIVQAYDAQAEALAGHAAWVAVMTTEPLPSQLTGCQNAEISQIFDSEDMIFPRVTRGGR